jgi:peptide/nickel transport system substrate-binding protein
LFVLAAAGGCRESDTSEVRALVIGEKLPRLADPASGRLTPADLVLAENAAQGLVRFDGAGNIVPGLAERWAVSNDGLSYVFRLRKAEWSDGRTVRARDVVRLLDRQTANASRNPLKDTVGAIRQIVAMTDRVVAIELSAPRPHLLQLLAHPEFSLVREGQGSGPFTVSREEDSLLLTRELPGVEEEEIAGRERVRLAARTAERAVAEFVAGKADLVLGGTSGDLAVALGARLPRGSLRVDPVAGLFGLVPARSDGPAGDLEVRALLDAALDRQALVAALGVPQLQPRFSLLQQGLDGLSAPFVPGWIGLPAELRRATLAGEGRRLFPVPEAAEEGAEAPARQQIRVALPAGPGGAIILERLKADWEPLGHLTVVAAKPGEAADFRWLDEVAPSTSPAWFLRSFRCDVAAVCLPEADRLLDAARLTGFAPQRSAFFAEAERQMREAVLFIPVAAPVRWSLAGRGLEGFSENRFARHPLSALREGAGARN